VSKSSRDSRSQAVGLQDWDSIAQSLDAHGNAVLPELLTAEQCEQLAAMYGRADGYCAHRDGTPRLRERRPRTATG